MQHYSSCMLLKLFAMVLTGAGRTIVVKVFYQLGYDDPFFMVVVYLFANACALPFHFISQWLEKKEVMKFFKNSVMTQQTSSILKTSENFSPKPDNVSKSSLKDDDSVSSSRISMVKFDMSSGSSSDDSSSLPFLIKGGTPRLDDSNGMQDDSSVPFSGRGGDDGSSMHDDSSVPFTTRKRATSSRPGLGDKNYKAQSISERFHAELEHMKNVNEPETLEGGEWGTDDSNSMQETDDSNSMHDDSSAPFTGERATRKRATAASSRPGLGDKNYKTQSVSEKFHAELEEMKKMNEPETQEALAGLPRVGVPDQEVNSTSIKQNINAPPDFKANMNINPGRASLIEAIQKQYPGLALGKLAELKPAPAFPAPTLSTADQEPNTLNLKQSTEDPRQLVKEEASFGGQVEGPPNDLEVPSSDRNVRAPPKDQEVPSSNHDVQALPKEMLGESFEDDDSFESASSSLYNSTRFVDYDPFLDEGIVTMDGHGSYPQNTTSIITAYGKEIATALPAFAVSVLTTPVQTLISYLPFGNTDLESELIQSIQKRSELTTSNKQHQRDPPATARTRSRHRGHHDPPLDPPATTNAGSYLSQRPGQPTNSTCFDVSTPETEAASLSDESVPLKFFESPPNRQPAKQMIQNLPQQPAPKTSQRIQRSQSRRQRHRDPPATAKTRSRTRRHDPPAAIPLPWNTGSNLSQRPGQPAITISFEVSTPETEAASLSDDSIPFQKLFVAEQQMDVKNPPDQQLAKQLIQNAPQQPAPKIIPNDEHDENYFGSSNKPNELDLSESQNSKSVRFAELDPREDSFIDVAVRERTRQLVVFNGGGSTESMIDLGESDCSKIRRFSTMYGEGEQGVPQPPTTLVSSDRDAKKPPKQMQNRGSLLHSPPCEVPSDNDAKPTLQTKPPKRRQNRRSLVARAPGGVPSDNDAVPPPKASKVPSNNDAEPPPPPPPPKARKRNRGSTIGLTAESKESVKWLHRIPWWLLPLGSAVFSMMDAAFRMLSVLYLAASIAEMFTSGTEIVLGVLAARFIRKRLIPKSRWAGTFITTIGLTLIACSDIISGDKNTGQSKNLALGIIFALGKAISNVSNGMSHELITQEAELEPNLLLGLEGCYGLTMAVPLYFIFGPLAGYFPADSFAKVAQSITAVFGIIGLLVILFLSSFLSTAVIAETSSMTRNMWKNFRGLVVWLLGLLIFYASGNDDLGEPWQIPNSFVVLSGFAIMMGGLYIYYKDKEVKRKEDGERRRNWFDKLDKFRNIFASTKAKNSSSNGGDGIWLQADDWNRIQELIKGARPIQPLQQEGGPNNEEFPDTVIYNNQVYELRQPAPGEVANHDIV